MSRKKDFEEVMKSISNGFDIDAECVEAIFTSLLDHELGEANETSLGAFLAGLEAKGATETEMLALIKVVLEHDGPRIQPHIEPHQLYGIVGSGKDEIKTFNISTCAAFVAATAGVPVVKNGSRSDTSLAGTTDVLEALGVNVGISINDAVEILNKTSMGFIDSGQAFPKMTKEYVGKVLFKNPLSYTLSIASGIPFKNMVFGISFDDTELVAQLLRNLGMRRCMVVAGHDEKGRHFDEISSIGPTKISELIAGEIRTYTIEPEDIGVTRGTYESIKQSARKEESCATLLSVLKGEASRETSDIVAMNAGALLFLSGKSENLARGVLTAKEIIASGEGMHLFIKFSDLTNKISTR